MKQFGDSISDVCSVIDSLNPGGAERLLVTVLKHVAQESESVPTVITLYPGGLFESEARQCGVKVVSLGDLRDLPAVEWISRFRSYLSEEQPKIVHGHLFPVSYLLSIASLGVDRFPNLVFTEHNVHNRRRKIWPFRIIERAIYSRFCKVICVSEDVRRALIRWVPSVEPKAEVLRNCIEIPRESRLGWEGKSWDIVVVGSLTRQKGHKYLIESVRELTDRGHFLRVAFAGSGPLRERLKQQVHSLGLERQIYFLGTVENVTALLIDSRIFVLPSEYEGLPIAVLEAMSLAMPVVATSVGGLPESIQNGATGLLVQPQSARALSAAIHALLRDPALARRLGEAAREWVVRECGVNSYVARLLDIYGDLAEVPRSK